MLKHLKDLQKAGTTTVQVQKKKKTLQKYKEMTAGSRLLHCTAVQKALSEICYKNNKIT